MRWTAAAVAIAVLTGCGAPASPAGTSGASVARSAEPAPTSTPTPAPSPGFTRREDPVLGYLVDLPDRYRLALSVVDGPSNAGRDFYVPRSEQEERDLCLREKGSDIGSPERVADLKIEVYANAQGLSPVDFASAPNRRIVFTSIEAVTAGGHEAARVVQQPTGDTAYYVIRANDRLYELAPLIISQPSLGNAGGTFAAPAGWLDQIAASFKAIPLQPSSAPPPARQTLCGV